MNWIYLGSLILGGVLSVSDYIKTRKPYKLIYVLFWAYMFIGGPILEKITSNNIIEAIYMTVGIIPMLIFTYLDVIKNAK
ncbi:hypothetical protein [Clostridium tagluense]|uniref:hypothetical protein n=1 Tax=Clostridium tagluense TaxID=360422 RepID=UPI001C6E6B9C|nr:hypothetical protein [Clostridium tagluense]MBW9158799.1 hypothetical protein [Clostridium tagluense]WLC67415.1 hypothetical protein KTC93_09670 [Clostridium tagluense]